MIPISILSYYTNEASILNERLNGDFNVVNNSSYLFVRLMPFVFLFKRKIILPVGIIALMMFFVVEGAKRGALVVGAVILIMYFYYILKTFGGKTKLKAYTIAIASSAILLFLGFRYIQDNQFLIDRLTVLLEGEGSGRDWIYTALIDGWYSSEDFAHLLFGFGFAGSRKLTGGLYAHNDWLEMTSNFGLLGIIAYLVLIISAIKTAFQNNWKKDKRILMQTIIAAWFITSLISMWYTNLFGYFQSILIAYIVGSNFKSLDEEEPEKQIQRAGQNLTKI